MRKCESVCEGVFFLLQLAYVNAPQQLPKKGKKARQFKIKKKTARCFVGLCKDEGLLSPPHDAWVASISEKHKSAPRKGKRKGEIQCGTDRRRKKCVQHRVWKPLARKSRHPKAVGVGEREERERSLAVLSLALRH
jgi:hypothetical protein